jgi:hypothetical protein
MEQTGIAVGALNFTKPAGLVLHPGKTWHNESDYLSV